MEAHADVVLRLAPLADNEASNMIASIRSNKLLGVFHGEAAVDGKALVQTVVGLFTIDAALALGQMDLAGHSLGLRYCWAGLFQMVARGPSSLHSHLAIPKDYRLTGAMTVGLPT